jgi:hypothetical protein
MASLFNKEQIKYIFDNYKNISNYELAEKFNNYFDTSLSVKQIKAVKQRNKLDSGLDGRFKKGNVPVNPFQKGKSASEKTQFKKGGKPGNFREVGSTRINADGYTEVKILNPNIWAQQHILIWEENKGKIPPGHVLIFADGNKRNLDISNLLLITRKQLLIMNQNKLIKNDIELTKTGALVAELTVKIFERKKVKHG